MRRMDANIYSTSESRLELGLVMLCAAFGISLIECLFLLEKMLPQDRMRIQGRGAFIFQ